MNNIIFQHPVAFKYSLHSILQSLMQLFVHQSYTSTTCFGHIGPSSGTIAIVHTYLVPTYERHIHKHTQSYIRSTTTDRQKITVHPSPFPFPLYHNTV
jgi:hypothetical protein